MPMIIIKVVYVRDHFVVVQQIFQRNYLECFTAKNQLNNSSSSNIYQVDQAFHKEINEWLSQLNRIILNQQLENVC
jgi:hypothetical protein